MANTNDAAIVNEIINSVSIAYRWKDYYKPLITLMKLFSLIVSLIVIPASIKSQISWRQSKASTEFCANTVFYAHMLIIKTNMP